VLFPVSGVMLVRPAAALFGSSRNMMPVLGSVRLIDTISVSKYAVLPSSWLCVTRTSTTADKLSRSGGPVPSDTSASMTESNVCVWLSPGPGGGWLGRNR